MRSEVEVLRLTFEGKPKRVDRRKVSSAVWKNLYSLTERGEAVNDYVLIKKHMQDSFLTFSELMQVGEREYVLYFMSPSESARLDVLRAMRGGIKIGREKMQLVDAKFIRYGLRRRDVYITLSPVIIVRNGEYYLPPEIDFFRNVLGYLEIKYQHFTGGVRVNLRKDNFMITTLYSRPVRINFGKAMTYGVHMGFKLTVSSDLLDVAATLIQLGIGSKTGMGYGFVMPKRVMKNEEIEFIVRHPRFWDAKKNEGDFA